MIVPVHVLGLDASGIESLSARARAALAAATFVAGGRRLLDLAGPDALETFAITNNVDELVTRLRDRRRDERCVVLASGDPLFFGIGSTLINRLGPDQVVVEPVASSLQLAFARVPCSWHDAALASVHGRPLAATLLPLLGLSKIGLLTQDGAGPSAVAEFFLQRELGDYTAWICEDLGAPDECVTRLPIADVVGRRFGDLNVIVLVRQAAAGSAFGADGTSRRNELPPDDQFARPDAGAVLLTHWEVRAITLSRFEGMPEGPIWDIGAGLGGVTVGLANRFRSAEVVAVERSESQVAYLRENRRRFEAWNVRVIHGEAPGAVAVEPAPSGVFLGGSGGRLDAILDVVIDYLRPGGLFVANFIGLENLSRTLERLQGAGWIAGVTQVAVAHGRELAGLTAFVPQSPIWIVRAKRPPAELRACLNAAD